MGISTRVFRGLGLGLLLAACVPCAIAHPLGNSTINRQAGILLEGDRIDLRYVLELAEIPTLIARGDADTDADGLTSAIEWQAWLERRADSLARQLNLRVDGRRLSLRTREALWKLTPGDAGLENLRLTFAFSAAFVAQRAAHIEYRDEFEPAWAGWKEVYARAGPGASLIRSDVPEADASEGLMRFEGEPPRMLSATVEYAPAAAWTTSRRNPPAPSTAGSPQADASSLPQETAPARSPGQVANSGSVPPASAANAQAHAFEFFRLGACHILQGPDHLLFLLGLLLLSPRLRATLAVVTAFTLAHSVTLALGVSGLLVAPGPLVEASIAGSIVYVGVMGWRGAGAAHGAGLAFLFGLVHGLGFAAGLAELLGRAGGSWLVPVAAFNLGIEAIQLAVVVLAVPLLRLAHRYRWASAAHRAASGAIAIAGTAWLITRAAAGIA